MCGFGGTTESYLTERVPRPILAKLNRFNEPIQRERNARYATQGDGPLPDHVNKPGGVVGSSENGLQPPADFGGAAGNVAPPHSGTDPVLVLTGATKTFGTVTALEDGSVTLYPGEAHALLGENGAGKSTVVKILAGVHHLDSGSLLINGEPAHFNGPTAARTAGIAVIYQEPTLFPDLSVAENIFMGRHPLGSMHRIDRAEMRKRAAAVFARLGVSLDPARPARGLSVADQQIVEIAKAISFDARVIIMDEPTAALSSVEVARLFDVVRTLRAENAAVLFISHRLEEAFAICQRVTIMRDGRFVRTSPIEDVTIDSIIHSMVGRDLETLFPKTESVPTDVVLDVQRLTHEGSFADVSFVVRRGEIVALAGLVGAGRSEIARAIFGIDRHHTGSVKLNGKELPNGSPIAAMRAGIGFVPEDRRQQGLVMDMCIDQNVALASLPNLSRRGLIRRSAERAIANDWAARLRLKFGRMKNPVSTLSGGNQQKVVLAKWLARKPTLLIIDEPTRGIDVGTKAEVHRLLDQLVHEGIGVLMISSELPEVLGMADRVLVVHEGRLVAEFARADASEAAIMRAATGQRSEAAA
jgi:rhamnose transport system ATP-binding protein